MSAPVNKPPEKASFLDLPVVSNWHGLDADAIIFGAPFGKPYRPTDFPNDQSSAPAALRAASGRVLLNDQALDIDFTPPACFGNLRVEKPEPMVINYGAAVVILRGCPC